MTIDPKSLTIPVLTNYLQSAVSPRPIALVSSMGSDGHINLSPFSFFNLFSLNPPILIFSTSRRVRDNTVKHTYENVLEVPEVVIHIVSHSMVQQTSLASTEYPKEVNEFVKAGFTQVRSNIVLPPRVGEAPVAMECKVNQVIPLGTEGGSGNLVLCEVLLIHIREEVLGPDERIDPFRLDAVARLGGDWYARVNAPLVFNVPKPLVKKGIGIDSLPAFIRDSKELSGNDLGQLANVTAVPELDLAHPIFTTSQLHVREPKTAIFLAKRLLAESKIDEAWQVLLYKEKDPAG
jgi:flavin reductase (DIM6/NTAB) family NADH-FMN oxidoreductase RutF